VPGLQEVEAQAQDRRRRRLPVQGLGFLPDRLPLRLLQKGAESESKGAEPKGGDGASTDGTKDAKPGDKGDKKAAPTKPAAAHERAAEKKKKKHG